MTFRNHILLLLVALSGIKLTVGSAKEMYPDVRHCFSNVNNKHQAKMEEVNAENRRKCEHHKKQSETVYKACLLELYGLMGRHSLPVKPMGKPSSEWKYESTKISIRFSPGSSIAFYMLAINFEQTRNPKAQAVDRAITKRIIECEKHNFVIQPYIPDWGNVEGDHLTKLSILVQCLDKAMIC